MSRAATRLGVAATALVLVGLGLSIYLTVEHFSASPSYACPTSTVVDCVKVTSSSYSTFLGVPVAVAGVVYFVVASPLYLPIAWRSSNVWIQRARWVWAGIGMVSVFWLVYGELDVGAICLYCTGVHLVTFGLLALTAIGSAMLIGGTADGADAEGTEPLAAVATPAGR